MFQNQQNASRGAPLGTNRLQNGKMGEERLPRPHYARASTDRVKLGGASQWAFGGAMGGAPGLSNTQTRTNGGAMSSFAQAMSGSQPHTPLNLE
jgi:CCR4-NOT transcription complex subunit 2